jgi:large subunit ribosomal protein L14e
MWTVVFLKTGPHAGHIAVIAEIIDHNRGEQITADHHCSCFLTLDTQEVIDGPTTGVPRQAFPYRHLTLTPPHRPKTSTQRQLWHCEEIRRKAEVVAKWESTVWAKKRAAAEKRRTLTDFERFQVMAHKKSRRDKVRKVLKAAKA